MEQKRCYRYWLLCMTVILSYKGTDSLRLSDVRVPTHVILGKEAKLECPYDLEGESLYSVKWYKDGNEIFRYLPGEQPPAKIFKLPGVIVDIYNSSDRHVVLKNVQLKSSGRYGCEVSGEAPSFQTVSEFGDMVVVDLPKEGPKISGGRPRYQIGDIVNVNCSSAKSNPAARLVWYINGEPANESLLRSYPLWEDEDGLQTSTMGLVFKVRPKHFRSGDLKLKCLATIAAVYWKSNEESVEGDRPQKAPVLESRETVLPGMRAASGCTSIHIDHFVVVFLLHVIIWMNR